MPRRSAWLGVVFAVALSAGCSPSGPAAPEPSRSTIAASPTRSASPTPTPTGSALPTRSSSPSGTPSPSTSTEPAPPDTSLKKNALYAVKLDSTKCSTEVRSPKPPLADRRLARYLRSVVDCLVKAYAKPMSAVGLELETPKIKTYAKTIKTPCGKFGQRGAPAYYCSATQTIYWPVTGDDGNEAYTFARLGYVALLAHEFGHHLQSVSGMLTEYGVRYNDTERKKSRYLLSRRLELQAQCFEGTFLRSARRSLDLSSQDRYQLSVWHSYTGDEDPPSSRKPDHGTSASQVRWLERGLSSGQLRRCNTWTASRKSVG